jgi:hypothetical protein
MMTKRKKGSFQSIKNLLDKYDWDRQKYITREFQDYGYRLATELDDLSHKSLYIKLAKVTARKILEQARLFVKDAYNVKNKARLFMWKVKELKNQKSNVKNKQSLFSRKLENRTQNSKLFP